MSEVLNVGAWSVQLPDGWTAVCREDCVTITAKEARGSLQISSYAKGSLVTDDDLRDFADSGTGPDQSEPVELGAYSGFASHFGEDRFFCRQWYLRHDQQMLFATYTCEQADRGLEDDSVAAILATLSPPITD